MSALPYLLVVVSAFTHAYWNFLLKRSRGGQLFVGLTKIAEVVLFAPVFLVISAADAARHAGVLWPLAIVGAALTLTNYVMLAMAYARADLSTVYPISRGAVLLFLPVLGYLVFGERLDIVGKVAVALVVAGIVILQLRSVSWDSFRGLGRQLGSSNATLFALLAAAAAAGYTVWDKRAVGLLAPFTYFYTYTVFVALAYAAHIGRRYGWSAARGEWRVHRSAIVQVGFFNTVTYLLVLFALRAGTSSYVIALRQLSVAFGVLLGWRLLGEPFGFPKRLGAGLIIAGTVLVALAR
ncbi:MAG: protein of unknown function transrane [Gemmatimonadetes bacterium]|nr:protein of unknown function transrane [Gemmatimonadota bacterium]